MKRDDFNRLFPRITKASAKKQRLYQKNSHSFSVSKNSDYRQWFLKKWAGTKAFLYPIFVKNYWDLVKKYCSLTENYWDLVERNPSFISRYSNLTELFPFFIGSKSVFSENPSKTIR